jgi:histidyl-tRNA synthetase
MGEVASEKVFAIASKLRANGVSVDFDHMNRGIKAQFKYADKIGAEYVGVVGTDELEKGIVKLKKMSDGSEIEVSFDSISEFILNA